MHKTKNTKNYLKWLVIFAVSIVGTLFCYQTGFLEFVIKTDSSRMCITIMSIYIAVSIYVGALLSKNRTINSRTHDTLWYATEFLFAAGLVGTVLGLTTMLTHFANIKLESPDTIQTAFSHMGSALGTALYTTLFGLVYGNFLKIQLLLLDDK